MNWENRKGGRETERLRLRENRTKETARQEPIGKLNLKGQEEGDTQKMLHRMSQNQTRMNGSNRNGINQHE